MNSKIEAAAAYPQQTTQGAHRILVPVLIDKHVSQLDSLAKKAAAFFKMSHSSRSRSFSRLIEMLAVAEKGARAFRAQLDLPLV